MNIDDDPIEQFRSWYHEHIQDGNFAGEPTAAVLATASRAGRPSVRMVLLKSFDHAGFVFFTNYRSRKGRELAENPQASLLFYWPLMGRQIRIEGAIERVSAEESDAYFRTRPREFQLSAWASRQSETIESRDELVARMEQQTDLHENREVTRPEYWGGYRLKPAHFEFWVHQESRLHDRVVYDKESGGWRTARLAP